MRFGVAGGVVAWASVAAAQPATEVPLPATHCSVTVAEAPAPVAGTIQEWAQGELHCKTSLVVRVFPVAHGLVIVATDPNGGVRQRVVPDADSAGVLVASWIADDAPPPSSPPAVGALVIPATTLVTRAAPPPQPLVAGRSPGPSFELDTAHLVVPGSDKGAWLLQGWLDLGHAHGWSFLVGGYVYLPQQDSEYTILGGALGASYTHAWGPVYLRGQSSLGTELSPDGGWSDLGGGVLDLEVGGGWKVTSHLALEAKAVGRALFSFSDGVAAIGGSLGVRVTM
ncbi:MAG TPA: hypothetical protein VGM88_00475 [Kofleriaceae bacterium]